MSTEGGLNATLCRQQRDQLTRPLSPAAEKFLVTRPGVVPAKISEVGLPAGKT